MLCDGKFECGYEYRTLHAPLHANAIHINARIESVGAAAAAAAFPTVTPLSRMMIIIIQVRLYVEQEIELGWFIMHQLI